MNDLMDKLKNVYFNNKKIINISLVIIILVLLFIILFNGFNNRETPNIPSPPSEVLEIEKIVLFGDLEIEINEGEEYIEPGFYAITKDGEVKRNEVEVISSVDTNNPGTYYIYYTLGDKKVSRKVIVLEKKVTIESDLTLTLNGNSLIVLNQGEKYIEPGYSAYDTIDGDLTDLVDITGSVDTNNPGTYILTYKVTNSIRNTKTLTRKIIVNESIIEAKVTQNTNNYTNTNVVITVSVSGTNFSYVRFPNSTVSKDKNSTYTVSKNGTYKFYIYDNNNNYILKEIKVTNIDKTNPKGTCQAKVENGKTYISSSINDSESGIKELKYYGNNNLLNTSSNTSYTVSSKLTNVYVVAYDKVGNSQKIVCNLEEEKHDLEVHYINVGREDAIVIRSSEKTIFIDGGSYSKKSTITPYLKNLGITHIDVMIGSHLHYNHIQAQADILENFTVDKIYYPQDLNTCYSDYCDLDDQKYILDAIKKYNKKISIMKVNDNINIGDMNIFCIGPIKFQTKSQNKYRQNYNSLNFILTYGDTKFMFTGDYMQYSNILNKFSRSVLDVDVLKYPHHGNATIGKDLVNAMSPRYVVLTNSRDELSTRNEKDYLEDVGSSFYYSYKHGNILILSDGKNLNVKTNVVPSDYKR